MERRKAEKSAALVLAAIVLTLAACGLPADVSLFSLRAGCALSARMAYPFVHAGLVHAALNAWCLLVLVFTCDITWRRLLVAYAVALCVPVSLLAPLVPAFHLPTVGLSGVVYALLGTISFEVARRRRFQLWMVGLLALGFVLPGCAAALHLCTYLGGLLIAWLNKPFRRKLKHEET